MNAKMFNKSPKFANKLKIHEKPVKTKSYYLLFTKNKSPITARDRQKIWEKVAELRNNEKFMEMVSQKY